MAYCRWSSDDWTCDLYCYESNRGFETHIAGSKYRNVPKITASLLEDQDAFFEQTLVQQESLHEDNMEDIDLPHAGESFTDSTLISFRDRLIGLRLLGYHFPNYVLADLEEEIEREKTA